MITSEWMSWGASLSVAHLKMSFHQTQIREGNRGFSPEGGRHAATRPQLGVGRSGVFWRTRPRLNWVENTVIIESASICVSTARPQSTLECKGETEHLVWRHITLWSHFIWMVPYRPSTNAHILN